MYLLMPLFFVDFTTICRPHFNIVSSVVVLFFRYRAKETRGIFPKSYVHLCEHNIVNGEYCIQRTDIVEEITKVLLEWGGIAKSYFLVSGGCDLFGLSRRSKSLSFRRAQTPAFR